MGPFRALKPHPPLPEVGPLLDLSPVGHTHHCGMAGLQLGEKDERPRGLGPFVWGPPKTPWALLQCPDVASPGTSQQV